MSKKLTKKELIAILVDDYGYEKEDIKMLTNAKLESMIKSETKDAEKLEHEETLEVMTEENHIKDEDLIAVMNGENGELIHRSSRTGRMWKFTRFGQMDKIPFIELVNIYNVNPKCFEEGRLIILNKEVAENFGLKEIYKHIITPQNIDSFFKKSVDELKEIVPMLPQSTKFTFISHARELFKQGKIDSLNMKNFIEEYSGVSLEDNAPISDKV